MEAYVNQFCFKDLVIKTIELTPLENSQITFLEEWLDNFKGGITSTFKCFKHQEDQLTQRVVNQILWQ